MGLGIAQVAATAGHAVILVDSNETALGRAKDAIQTSLAKLVSKGRVQESAQRIFARISFSQVLDELATCDLIIEAIVEQLAAKQTLFLELESRVESSCILATNTSSIPTEAIGERLIHPERVVGLHFFNPAPLMGLVEVILGLETDRAIIEPLCLLMQSWGKTPVKCVSAPGFIVNRVARGFYTEGLAALTEIPLPPSELDLLFTANGLFKMGPCRLTDLIGQDVNASVTVSLFEQFDFDPRYRPPNIQKRLIQAGLLGDKAKNGGIQTNWQVDSRVLSWGGSTKGYSAVSGRLSLLEHLASYCSSIDLPDNCLEVDGHKVSAIGVPEAQDDWILVDWSRNPDSKVVGINYQSANTQARKVVNEWFTGHGFSVVDLNTRPGGVIAVTLAMLLNEALEAWYQNVASPADIDHSMKLGLNHPAGPFEWATAERMSACKSLLSQLQHSSGGERYRPSAGFTRWLSDQGHADELH